jgi:hypothetical protein
MRTIQGGNEVTLVLYTKRTVLLDTPGWKQFRQLIKNSKMLARMANQAKCATIETNQSTSLGSGTKEPPRGS